MWDGGVFAGGAGADGFVRPRGLGRKYDVTYAEVVVHGVCGKCND